MAAAATTVFAIHGGLTGNWGQTERSPVFRRIEIGERPIYPQFFPQYRASCDPSARGKNAGVRDDALYERRKFKLNYYQELK